MKKGFTLVELLGVISILAIIGAIVVPVVSTLINKSMDNIDDKQKKSIVIAAKNWKANHIFDNKECVLISTLIDEGYLDNVDIKSAKTNKQYDVTTYSVKIKNEGTETNPKYKFTIKKEVCS